MRHDLRFLKLLSALSVLQGASFIVLLGVAVPVKYLAGCAAALWIRTLEK